MTTEKTYTIPHFLLKPIIQRALEEDLGQRGDVTTLTTIPSDRQAKIAMVSRQQGVLAGLDCALMTFDIVDPSLNVTVLKNDGDDLQKGDVICTIQGKAQSILMAERVALNFACHLSGIATLTAAMVAETAGTQARIVCTRKTTPGLRVLQKQAVRLGGGSNHRFGLDDAVLIKDNHLAAGGGIIQTVERVRKQIGHLMKIEVECDTLQQVEQALQAKADVIMFDNMSLDDLHKAVDLVSDKAITEASGGVRLETVRAIAETGVQMISSGALTHSFKDVDLAFDFVDELA